MPTPRFTPPNNWITLTTPLVVHGVTYERAKLVWHDYECEFPPFVDVHFCMPIGRRPLRILYGPAYVKNWGEADALAAIDAARVSGELAKLF